MAYYGIEMNDGTELTHYGVKGMKWGKRRSGKKVQSSDGKFARENRDSDWQKADSPIVYESNTFQPTTTINSNYYKEHYKVNSGSKFVNTVTKIKANTKIANLKTTSAAIAICNSKASLPLKLIAVGTAKASNAISNKIVKTANSILIKNAMKKK